MITLSLRLIITMIFPSIFVFSAYTTPSALLLAVAVQKRPSFAALTRPSVRGVDLLLASVLLLRSQLLIPTHYVAVFASYSFWKALGTTYLWEFCNISMDFPIDKKSLEEIPLFVGLVHVHHG